jgi:hypothetical protein
VITGSVRIDGAAAAAKRVLVVSGDGQRLLASAETAADGSFEVAVDERPVHLIVKLQGPHVGIVTRELGPGDGPAEYVDVDVDTAGDGFHPVTGTFVGGPRPPFVLVSFDPVHLDGVAPDLQRFSNRRDHAVVEATFFSQQVHGCEFEVFAQAGRYRIRGGYVIKARPVVAGPTGDVVVVEAAVEGTGNVLSGDAANGFDLPVTGPTHLRLVLTPTDG